MAEYIITCPICKKQYKLTPKDPSTLAQKSFACPNCRYSAPFTQLIKGLPAAPVTHSDLPPTVPAGPVNLAAQGAHAATRVVSGGPAVNHNATRVAGSAQQPKAHLTVVNTSTKFVLNPGMYVLGRKSSDSPATLQLAPDISMSREHARLAVKVVGGKVMAQIVGLKANNPFLVNGKVLAAGQPYTLKSGDRLKLGNTQVVYTL